jgi:hypothetical protein
LTVVEFTTVTPLTETPPPETLTDVTPVRLVPVRVTGTLVPRVPEVGAIEVSAGAGGFTTVKVIGLLVPVVVVTVTFLPEAVAPAEIVNVAVIVVELTTLTPLTETPPPPTLIVAGLDRLAPVRVTGTVVPRVPELGAMEANVGAAGLTTVNVTASVVVPIGVVTVTDLGEAPAPPEIAKVAVTVVELTTVTPLTVIPPPETFTAVAPERLVPVRVTGTLVPRVPELGAIELNVGPCTVNVAMPLVPPGVVTVTFLEPRAAFVPPAITKVAVMEVELTTVTPLIVTPVPEIPTVVPLVVKLVPVKVTGTLVPRTPELGAIEARVGGGGLTTENVAELLVPPPALTVTLLSPTVALGSMVKVAVTVVALTTERPLTVTPFVPLPDRATITALVVKRFVPVRVTETLLPRAPDVGSIDVRVGGGTTTSTAPISNTLPCGRWVPKKSWSGAKPFVLLPEVA